MSSFAAVGTQAGDMLGPLPGDRGSSLESCSLLSLPLWATCAWAPGWRICERGPVLARAAAGQVYHQMALWPRASGFPL